MGLWPSWLSKAEACAAEAAAVSEFTTMAEIALVPITALVMWWLYRKINDD